MQVIKRNGDAAPFNFQKIKAAVNAAFRDCGKDEAPEKFINDLESYFNGFGQNHVFTIEGIQDVVETTLMRSGFYDVAKYYILYRESHKELRFIKERIDYMDKYARNNRNAAASSETDANANVSIKNVANLDAETYKSLNRQIQRYRMEKKIRELFPELANRYKKDLESHVIYCHDEASSPAVKNYCEAVSLWPLITKGSSSIDGLGAGAPTNLSSFAGQFCNLVFLLSAQCKGAVAFGGFFIAFNWYCVRDFGEDYYKRTDEMAVVHSKKTIGKLLHQYYQQIVYTINQPAGNRSFQSPFTNFSYYSKSYFDALFGEFAYPDEKKPTWEQIDFLQQDFMEWFNKERTKTLLTFPVETMALMSDGKDIVDKDYKELTAEMYAKGHSFFTYISDNPNALASCCRLRNQINENVFSFTSGLTGIQTGSVNVITLNLNRIIQNWARENAFSRDYLKVHFKDKKESFRAYLETILERVYKYHIAYKTLIYETEDAGMLGSSNAGYISMQKLYSTIGVNGVNEAAEFIGLVCRDNSEYRDFCRLVTGTISTQNKTHGSARFLFNQEFVPAESLSSKNYNWDKKDGYWVPKGRVLYNSYFYLADDKDTSVLEKFRLHGREFTELLDGGVGLHCNLEEHLSKEQYLSLIDYAIKVGTSYFTFNVPNSECTNQDCHHIVKVPMDKCPKCGAPMRQWTRIIGYLRPIDNFDSYRQAEAGTRIYAKKIV